MTDLAISDDGKRIVACFGRPARAELDRQLSGQEYPEGVVGWDLGDTPAVQSFAGTLPAGVQRDEALGVDAIIAPSGADWFAHQIRLPSEERRPTKPDGDTSREVSWVVFRSCRDGHVLFKLGETEDAGLMTLSASRDGRVLAILHDGSMQLWNVAGRRRLPTPNHGYERIEAAVVDPMGRRVLIQGRIEDVTEQVIWDLESHQPVEATRMRFSPDKSGTRTTIRCLGFDRVGSRMARYVKVEDISSTSGLGAPLLKSHLDIVDTATGQVVARLGETNGSVSRAVFVDEGKSLFYTNYDRAQGNPGTWHWDPSNEEATRIHEGGGLGLLVSSDERRLLLNELDPEQIFRSTLTLLDVETRQVVYQSQADQQSSFLLTGTGDVLEFPFLHPVDDSRK